MSDPVKVRVVRCAEGARVRRGAETCPKAPTGWHFWSSMFESARCLWCERTRAEVERMPR